MNQDISFSTVMSRGFKLLKENPFPLKKRVTLSEFAHYMAFTNIAVLVLTAIPVVNFLLLILYPLIMISLFCWWIARMHDVNRVGWWVLVPGYSFFLSVLPSHAQENRWQKIQTDMDLQMIPEQKMDDSFDAWNQDIDEELSLSDIKDPDRNSNLSKNNDDYLLEQANKDLDRMLNV